VMHSNFDNFYHDCAWTCSTWELFHAEELTPDTDYIDPR
jgi:hypothetical protein